MTDEEIFLKAFQNLNGFDVAKKFSSWIYRIAHNEAVNFLKKLKIQTVNLDEVEFILFDSSNDFAKYFDLKIEKQKVESALAKLNFKYLDPLVLHYFEDKSYEEIAEILKIPKKDDV
jgi:RNA polymerase sigma-70 factor (ECF subfamily)